MKKHIKKIHFLTLALFAVLSILLYLLANITETDSEIRLIIFYILVVLLCFYIITNLILVLFAYFWKRRRRIKGDETDKDIKKQIGLIRFNVRFHDYYRAVWRNRKSRYSKSVLILDKYIERMNSKNEIKEIMVISFFISILLQASILLRVNGYAIIYSGIMVLFSFLTPYLIDLLILRTRYEESLFEEAKITLYKQCCWCKIKISYWDSIVVPGSIVTCSNCNRKYVAIRHIFTRWLKLAIFITTIIIVILLVSSFNVMRVLPILLFIVIWAIFYIMSFIGYLFLRFKQVE